MFFARKLLSALGSVQVNDAEKKKHWLESGSVSALS